MDLKNTGFWEKKNYLQEIGTLGVVQGAQVVGWISIIRDGVALASAKVLSLGNFVDGLILILAKGLKGWDVVNMTLVDLWRRQTVDGDRVATVTSDPITNFKIYETFLEKWKLVDYLTNPQKLGR